MRSHQQKTSFHTLRTRLGSGDMSGFAGVSLGPFLRAGQPFAKHRAQAAVNDRASDRDAAPQLSLTAASTALFKIGPLEASGNRPQRYEARGEGVSSRGDILCPSGT